MEIIGRVVKRGAPVAVLVVAATTTGGPLVGEAHSDPAALTVLHWNIAGATINPFDTDKPDNEGTFDVVRKLVDEVESAQPHLISMNETCRLQADFATQQLTNRVGPVATAFADTGNHLVCAAGGVGPSTDRGNALLAVGADGVWERQVLYFTDEGSITSEQTDRAAICMLVSFRSTLDQIVRACSVHLATDDATARAQAAAFADFMIENAGPYPVVLAGDFNAPPHVLRDALYAPAQNGQGEFLEVDHPQDEPTFRDGTKLDYIFGDQDHFQPGALGEVIEAGNCPVFPFIDHPCSDHSKLLGQLVFRDDAPTPPDPEEPPDPVPEPPPDMAPFVTAGPAVTGGEGVEIALLGAADDDHGMPSVTWSYESVDGVDPGATCTIAEPHRARTSITCTDDGVFRVTLTADDGVNDLVSSSTTVTVENVAPTLRLSGPTPWAVFRAGTSVDLTAPFTDPGANDSHSCEVDWDDGVREIYAATGRTCSRSHTFGSAGMYTIDVAVTDDDGGSDRATVMVVVYDPDAGFVTGGGHLDSPSGALTMHPTASGRAHFNLNPRYQPHDEGPVPSNGKVTFSLDGTDLRLESTAFEWLVVNPDGKAAVKGTGTVAGVDGYGFVFYAYDEPNQVRLVIWSLADGPTPDSGAPLYDNSAMASFDLDDAEPGPTTGGSIVIHT